ncbi:hypothetical protein RHGRI_023751 [Rhododendron griersonianum]|nr:hypothetical protein RHGRI_023751 [Rhododendron griersonianum]KAG5536070.1 hypothetical protein RHGRI_023751 [Rhododendron griersonianum]
MRDLRQVRRGLGLDAFMVTPEDAKKKNVEHILILSGDHLYQMDYMDFVQKHVNFQADIMVSCVPDSPWMIGML